MNKNIFVSLVILMIIYSIYTYPLNIEKNHQGLLVSEINKNLEKTINIKIKGNNQKQSPNQIKFGSFDKNNISSFKLHNVGSDQKEIKNKSDRNKIIDLINSVSITKSGVEPRDGSRCGVTITYSNGQKFSVSFLASTIYYSIGDKEGTFYDIDKNIVEDLSNYYDKN
ncbi:hypothetical protein [Clostridium tagluense]|uniref:hypothetical protein n=1 Tax=Clostridium tagluense TaxID=360422 RepID=UPI001C6F0507|nr:hypothetical protein [Clostridium tagluense]MBW9159011.1 hypothetical protein [Clostridium tagluense]WLC68248.1 hypothetical protein KTC93_25015 [Clostridium tagluense]